MEEHIDIVEKVCTQYFGEEGIGLQIAHNLRDGMIFDAVQRLGADDVSLTATAVCHELSHHLPYERVCSAALEKLDALTTYSDENVNRLPQQRANREIVAVDGGGLIFAVMANHSEISNLQIQSVHVLGQLFGSLPRSKTNHLVSNSNLQLLFGALERFPENEKVQAAVLYAMCRIAKHHRSDEHEVKLTQDYSKSISICLAALEHHPTNLDVVCDALSVLGSLKRCMEGSYSAFYALVRRDHPNAYLIMHNTMDIQYRMDPENYFSVELSFMEIQDAFDEFEWGDDAGDY